MALWNVTTSSQLLSSFVRLDAEFFKPEFVEAGHKISKVQETIPMGDVCERLTQGSNPRFSESGIPCVNGKNVYFGTMSEGEPNYVGADEYRRLCNYQLRKGDLLITLKHATKVGRCWLVEDDKDRIFSRNIGLIRLRSDSSVSAILLLLYLWSKIGQLLLDRSATGGTTGQITLPMSELRRIPVPTFSEEARHEIESLFQTSREASRASANAYTQAQQLLESELGLDKLEFQKPVGYTARFSELEHSRRSDAQHYQPRFTQLLAAIEKHDHARIRAIRTFNRRGVQPNYVNGGDIAAINSQHLGPQHLAYGSFARTSRKWFDLSPVAHVQPDDLLIYTTGAYVGRTNVYLDDLPAMASNHVNILRLIPGIDAAYMAMVLQSRIGQFQTERHARGSAQAELYPADIDKFVVPLLPIGLQNEIGDLVRSSLTKQRESKSLLDQAKARVEQLIEEAMV